MNRKCLMSIFLLCFVSCSLATPTPLRLRRDVSSEESLLPKDVNESVKKITDEIGKSVKNLLESSQWIYKSLTSIVRNTMQEGFQHMTTWLVDLVVRMEFLSMADGSHLFFPLNGKPEIEQEYKTVAIAVSKLMMNLKTMERADKVVRNVTKHLVTKDADPHFQELKAAPEKMLRTALHTYFETLDHEMEADEDLQVEYKQRKTEAKEEVKRDRKMREPLVKVWEKHQSKNMEEPFKKFLEDKKILRQAIVNKVFLKHASKHFMMIFSEVHHRHFLLARALIQKARSVSNSDSKINEVYHQALVGAATALLVEEDDDKVATVLFNLIEGGLESDPTLDAEIRTMMKQIEGNTVYDIDMFYEDFSIL